ncbi:MAG: HAD-IIIA family hydrolase [Nitrospirae bacterium]|nr:HAD-IIIA family hydrolase [Nitrospirota bacterium]
MHKAIFLDRDGVINRLVWNPSTGEFESPHHVKDLEIYPWTLESLSTLRKMGYLLFLISNQPSYAKGKTSMENIKEIHDKIHRIFEEHQIDFADYYYCYHHPHGIVPELTGTCQCRKPGTLFLSMANDKYYLSLKDSWLIGDRDSDIVCGQSFGLRTIQIQEQCSIKNRGESHPDFIAENLKKATQIVADYSNEIKERGVQYEKR